MRRATTNARAIRIVRLLGLHESSMRSRVRDCEASTARFSFRRLFPLPDVTSCRTRCEGRGMARRVARRAVRRGAHLKEERVPPRGLLPHVRVHDGLKLPDGGHVVRRGRGLVVQRLQPRQHERHAVVLLEGMHDVLPAVVDVAAHSVHRLGLTCLASTHNRANGQAAGTQRASAEGTLMSERQARNV